jgi:hypothetical protein
MDFKNNDVIRWWYSEDELKRRNHGNNNGTTYWCMSQLAIFKDGFFRDTFWWHGSDNKKIYLKELENVIEFKYLGNLDDYEKHSNPYERYNPDDILNLNHANNSRDNIYLKKGAKIDRNVVEKNLKEELDKVISEASYYTRRIESMNQKIEEFNETTDENLDKFYF